MFEVVGSIKSLPVSRNRLSLIDVQLRYLQKASIIMIIIIIKIFTEEGLSHSKVLFTRVLYKYVFFRKAYSLALQPFG